jgi:hypothetical protein
MKRLNKYLDIAFALFRLETAFFKVNARPFLLTNREFSPLVWMSNFLKKASLRWLFPSSEVLNFKANILSAYEAVI